MAGPLPRHLLPDSATVDDRGRLSIGGCDVVSLAEPDPRPLGAVLVPQGDQLLLDLVDLVDDGLLAAVRELLPELGALLAQAFDLVVDLGNRPHAS